VLGLAMADTDLSPISMQLSKIAAAISSVQAINNGYTVATLPAGTLGQVAYVTDATAPTYLGTLTGSGSVVCPVFFNGVAWVSG
jgi:hypothetical protein